MGGDTPAQTTGGAFGGMLPSVPMPVSAPVSAPKDYSYTPDDTGLPQGFSYSRPNDGLMYDTGMPGDGGRWVYGPQGRVSTNDPSFLNAQNAPTGFDTTLPTQAPVSTTGLNLN